MSIFYPLATRPNVNKYNPLTPLNQGVAVSFNFKNNIILRNFIASSNKVKKGILNGLYHN